MMKINMMKTSPALTGVESSGPLTTEQCAPGVDDARRDRKLSADSMSSGGLAGEDIRYLQKVRRSSQKIAALSRRSRHNSISLEEPFRDEDYVLMRAAPVVIVTKEDVRSIVEETKQLLMIDANLDTTASATLSPQSLPPPPPCQSPLEEQPLQQVDCPSEDETTAKEAAWYRKASSLSAANVVRTRVPGSGPHRLRRSSGRAAVTHNFDLRSAVPDITRSECNGRVLQQRGHPQAHSEWKGMPKGSFRMPPQCHQTRDGSTTDDNEDNDIVAKMTILARNAASWPRASKAHP